ncbi:MAG: rRNA maturation RNase YbeY [Parcubacteria group bacterium CG1_02_40_25]|nr:MAG: rRNA maturation RNase YbeY [Parcubacteria group bacterium CG1_02_40_25]
MPLLVTNLTRFQVDKKWLEKIGQKVWRILDLDNRKKVGLILVTSPRIQELNKKFRHKDEVTDILSFNYQENDIPQDQDVFFGHTSNDWGDLVVCLKQVKDHARAAKKPWQAELTEVLIHGILHLMGMDHVTKIGYRQMETKTRSVLGELNF